MENYLSNSKMHAASVPATENLIGSGYLIAACLARAQMPAPRLERPELMNEGEY